MGHFWSSRDARDPGMPGMTQNDGFKERFPMFFNEKHRKTLLKTVILGYRSRDPGSL